MYSVSPVACFNLPEPNRSGYDAGMGIELLTERLKDQIAGVLGCWDRVLIFGTLPKICYAEGMTSYLYAKQVRIFDYPKFAEPFRDRCARTPSGWRRQRDRDRVHPEAQRPEGRSGEAGAGQARRAAWSGVHLLGDGAVFDLQAMARQAPGKTFLRPDDGKCLHYYFYFIDEELGLCYVRVPTWLPCRLQIYFNGHNWLASKLRRQDIEYKLVDNAFVEIADWKRAQQLANGLEMKRLHGKLDQFARTYCPIHRDFGVPIPLERGSMRVRHRRRVQTAGRLGGDLWHPDPHGDSHGEAGQHRHVPGPKAQPAV